MKHKRPQKSTVRGPVASVTYYSFIESLMHKIASLCLLYVTLAISFILPLAITALKEPEIISSITQDAPLPFLTPLEASHMHDVHVLIAHGMFAAEVAIIFLVIYGLRVGLSRALFKDALVMSFVLCALLIPFQYTFEWFHAAFFPQGNWQFAPDSWLITHFPFEFFFRAAITWFAATVISLAILVRVLPQQS